MAISGVCKARQFPTKTCRSGPAEYLVGQSGRQWAQTAADEVVEMDTAAGLEALKRLEARLARKSSKPVIGETTRITLTATRNVRAGLVLSAAGSFIYLDIDFLNEPNRG